jgi:hypothetical protein
MRRDEGSVPSSLRSAAGIECDHVAGFVNLQAVPVEARERPRDYR